MFLMGPNDPRKDLRLKFGEGINEFVQKALIRRPMLEGANISVPGLTLAGHSGRLFKVIKSQPSKIPVEVGEDTKIEIRGIKALVPHELHGA